MSRQILECPLCGGFMKKTVHCKGGCSGQIMGLGLILMGLGLTITVIGAIIGIPLIVYGNNCSRAEKVWMCKQCKNILPRG